MSPLILLLGSNINENLLKNIIDKIKNINNILLILSSEKELNNMLNEFDIYMRLSTIETICKNIKRHNENINGSLNFLMSVLIEIEELLVILNNKIDYHKTKYFNKYRKNDLTKEIENLKTLNNKLEKRYNILIDTLKI